MTLESIRYKDGKLEILDQLLLPGEYTYIDVKGVEDGWQVIHKMQVRGAPAIAIVGCLSLAAELYSEKFTDKKLLRQEIEGKLNYLVSARPTAVNVSFLFLKSFDIKYCVNFSLKYLCLQMKMAADDFIRLANEWCADDEISTDEMKEKLLEGTQAMLLKDISDNMAIGLHGANSILSHSEGPVRVLTHCNTGSLATSGYGTALGVIRKLYELNRLEKVYCTETRPYNQGARLTAFELVHENIPATLICDSMVAALFRLRVNTY